MKSKAAVTAFLFYRKHRQAWFLFNEAAEELLPDSLGAVKGV